jgi:hypothetical protein
MDPAILFPANRELYSGVQASRISLHDGSPVLLTCSSANHTAEQCSRLRVARTHHELKTVIGRQSNSNY